MIKQKSILLLANLAFISINLQGHAEAPETVTIPPTVNGKENPIYNGSGCPHGSARAIVSPDRESFTMLFDKFFVSANGPHSSERKDCKIIINFKYPQGWSHALFRLDYRGFYDLTAGAEGYHQALYDFAGSSNRAHLQTNFIGPTLGNYTISDSIDESKLIWSPCNEHRPLYVDTVMIAKVTNNGAGHAYLTTDSVDGSISTSYAFVWKRCGSSENKKESL